MPIKRSDSEYSIINIIKENNSKIDIQSIDIEEEKDNYFPTSKTSLIINTLLCVFYSMYNYRIKKKQDIYEMIKCSIRCGNLIFFKYITQIKSLELRHGFTKIISKSFDSNHDDYDDETPSFGITTYSDGDNQEDDDNISDLFEFDSELISKKVNDILHFTHDLNYELQLKDFLSQFKKNGYSCWTSIKSFPVLIDDSNSLIKKKIILLCGIFRNNDSETAKLKNVSLFIENNDRYYAENLLLTMRSIPKSVWHFIYSIDINFLINMLLWTESTIGENPHNIVCKSRPLIVYLKECIIKNTPKEKYISKILTPNVYLPSDEEKDMIRRNKSNLINSLDEFIRIIDDVKDVKNCISCKEKVHLILNGKETSSSSSASSSSSTPSKKSSFNNKTLHKKHSCIITDNLMFLKRKIHNLNKHTSKNFIDGESKETAAAAPAFKQILSLIGTLSNISNNINESIGFHPSLREIIDIDRFESPFDFISKTPRDLELFENMEEMNLLTVSPLDLNDIFMNENYNSYLLFFDNNVKSKINVSIHKIFIEKSKKPCFQIIDLYMKNENDLDSIGLNIICNTVDEIINYFKTSPIYSHSKIDCNIYLMKFTDEQQEEIMNYINSLV